MNTKKPANTGRATEKNGIRKEKKNAGTCFQLFYVVYLDYNTSKIFFLEIENYAFDML